MAELSQRQASAAPGPSVPSRGAGLVDLDVKWFLYNTRTGRQLQQLPVYDCGWNLQRNGPGDYKVIVPGYDPRVAAMDLMNRGQAGQVSAACFENGSLRIAGPVWDTDYDYDEKAFVMNGAGMWSFMKRRNILPAAAMTTPLVDSEGIPTSATGTDLTNLEYGTIVKRVLQQMISFPNGDLPLVFEADRPGTHERHWRGIDLKDVDSFLRQITQLEDGIDIEFNGRLVNDRVEFLVRTATDAQRFLESQSIFTWDMTSKNPRIRKLRIKSNIDQLGSLAWMSAGRQDDVAIASMSYDPYLIDRGFPLMEITDTGHTSVSNNATLDAYARQYTKYGRLQARIWEFEVKPNARPYVSEYNPGDICKIRVEPDGVVPGGWNVRKISTMSRGSINDEWIKINTEAVYE